jgi:protein translocase SecG subunit
MGDQERDGMAIIKTALQVLFLLDCLALMVLVLIQMSEHATLGGAFGAGMSATVFGRDVTRDPKKLATGVLGGVFLGLGLILTIL